MYSRNSKYSFSSRGRGRGRGGFVGRGGKKQTAPRPKNNKGNYPYPWNDLLDDHTPEVMVHLSPETISIDRLDIMRDGYVSEIKRLVAEYNRQKDLYDSDEKMKSKMTFEKYIKKKFKKADIFKIENQLRIENEILEDDKTKLRESGLSHDPVTPLCKTIKLLEYLKKFYLEDKGRQSMSIYLRFMEDEFKQILIDHPTLVTSYKRYIDWMNEYAKTQDLVKFQMVTKHELMPPLNAKGFVKLDDWQEEAIDRMRVRESTILSIPTSGGKTYLSAYLTKSKGRIVFLAPSIPLARQVAAYLTRVTGHLVPYMTDTYRPYKEHDEMVECLKSNRVIVSTPDVFLDFVPDIGVLSKDDNLIIDEIHMMGSHQGDSMETISILNQDAMLLGLSATVSNPEDLISWSKKLGSDLSVISSSKRFFNLQTAYWDTKTKSVINLNPLSMLDFEDFTSGNVLKKDLKPTPPDIYELSKKLEDVFNDEMGSLKLNEKFSDLWSRRVTLSEVKEYFDELINFMVIQSKGEKAIHIGEIINSFMPVDLKEEKTDLLEIITNLRDTKNTPVLIFERNTYSLMRIARELLFNIDQAEKEMFPDRLKEIEKIEKQAKRRQKEREKAGLIASESSHSKGRSVEEKSKKKSAKAELAKIEKMESKVSLEEIAVEHPQNPTKPFNWCVGSNISESEIAEIEESLRKYFPKDGDYYHPIIHALWRGIGIYAEGLPEDYLVKVQVMANEKKLGVVLSDKSMTFGVSMPFRNVVIYRDPTTDDDLNPLLFKQMEGRAGRRGQDTKGSVIFAGYSWKRIEELSVSEIPKVEGQCEIENIYLPVAQKLSEVTGTNIDFRKIFTHNLYRHQNPSDDEFASWEDYIELWDTWAPDAMKGDKNKLRMLWQSRNYGCDGIAFYHIVDALERKFHNGDICENRQIEAAHILSFFIQNKRAKKKSHILPKPDDYDLTWKSIRQSLLESGIPLEDDDYLDGRVFKSIKYNKLVMGSNDKDYQEIRENFFKFACILRILQNYCYYSKRVTLAKIMGKLFTRFKWDLWLSSPLINFSKVPEYQVELEDDDLIYEEE